MGIGTLGKHFGRPPLFATAVLLTLSGCNVNLASVLASNGSTTQAPEVPYCTTRNTYAGGVTLTGQMNFEYRPLDILNGLSGNPVAAGIPVAEIQIYNSSGTLVQCGETADDGSYSLTVPAGAGTYQIALLSRSMSTELNISILEDFYLNQPYVLSKSVTVTGASSSVGVGTLTASARSTVSSKIEGGAFNIYFQLWRANKFLRDSLGTSVFTAAPKVSVYWKKGYNPYNYFGSTSLLSFYRPSYRQLFILGGDGGAVNNVDTDHFDNSVIIHEYGHFLEDVYGHSDSPGGSHTGNFIIDPRLAWSEGWANFFETAVQRYYDSSWKYYIDTVGFKNDTVEGGTGYIQIKVDMSIAGSNGSCYSGSSQKCDQVTNTGEGTFHEMSISRYLYKMTNPTSSSGAGVPWSVIWGAFAGSDVSGSPVGFHSGQISFRNIALFSSFLQTGVAGCSGCSSANYSTILNDEKQATTKHYYADNLSRVTVNTCSARTITPTVDLGANKSNLYSSNNFYQFDYDGTANSLKLIYTNGSSNMDLDVFIYAEDYLYQEASASENGTIVARSARLWSIEQGTETVSLSGLSAGRYLINVKAYTYGKISANLGATASYNLRLVTGSTTEDLCPAH